MTGLDVYPGPLFFLLMIYLYALSYSAEYNLSLHYKTFSMQTKLVGLILTVLGIVGICLSAAPYLIEGNSKNYDANNITLYGFISMTVFVLGVIVSIAGYGKSRITR